MPGCPTAFELTPFELASHLSYQFWDTMPDEALWNAARSGALATADGWTRAVERVIADPRTRGTLEASSPSGCC